VANKSVKTLQRSSDFKKIKEFGKKRQGSPWLTLIFISNDGLGLRFGMTVTRKVGPAVVRNKVRRWCREFFRLKIKAGASKDIDVNVLIRPMPDEFYKTLSYQDFKSALEVAFEKID
jgi:ribonuclease P protein component